MVASLTVLSLFTTLKYAHFWERVHFEVFLRKFRWHEARFLRVNWRSRPRLYTSAKFSANDTEKDLVIGYSRTRLDLRHQSRDNRLLNCAERSEIEVRSVQVEPFRMKTVFLRNEKRCSVSPRVPTDACHNQGQLNVGRGQLKVANEQRRRRPVHGDCSSRRQRCRCFTRRTNALLWTYKWNEIYYVLLRLL